jgi:hypothetical protein
MRAVMRMDVGVANVAGWFYQGVTGLNA